jgi:hypothetical protein
MAAGANTPPRAATTGRARRRGLESSPRIISCLISRPTTKKKIGISPLFTQWPSVSVWLIGPNWIGITWLTKAV